MALFTVGWWLLVGHSLCDFPLQGDFLAKGKNHKRPIPGVPWWICLGAHALIQGGAVALATGMPMLGVGEALTHAFIDWAKCEGWIDFKRDQATHIFWKVIWLVIWGLEHGF